MRQNMFWKNTDFVKTEYLLDCYLIEHWGSPPFGGSQEEYDLLLKCI
jgi:hypothetical protein